MREIYFVEGSKTLKFEHYKMLNDYLNGKTIESHVIVPLYVYQESNNSTVYLYSNPIISRRVELNNDLSNISSDLFMADSYFETRPGLANLLTLAKEPTFACHF